MKNRKIIIAGGTGFIGQELVKYFGKENDIVVLTRNIKNAANNRNRYNSLSEKDADRTRFIQWDGAQAGEWSNELEGTDILINLAGKSVNCRYTEKNKKEIFDSRIHPVNALGKVVQQCSNPPMLWINASSATIYRHAKDKPQDEYSGEYQNDFSVQVCQLWEKTFFDQITPHTRKLVLRMAINIGPGGILIPYFNLLKFGLGGKQGNGKQMFSWVHSEDVCRMVEWIYEHPEINGIYNCSSPNPVTNNEFMKTLRKVTGYSFGLPATEWMLKIGAGLIGTETELILKSRWVLPTKILETGFQFKYPLLKDAFADSISKVPGKQFRLFS